ncbi:MAG: hypothetical protein K2Q32_06545 [Alphaproteobacteria bacterium]|nr:hypothetical protein [Alphaproteobacteria bacterium]
MLSVNRVSTNVQVAVQIELLLIDHCVKEPLELLHNASGSALKAQFVFGDSTASNYKKRRSSKSNNDVVIEAWF